ncbi:segregation and condensation protein B [Kribbella aluminosa]|uniref:Segregation and condensation protein B n=1 Tax=Kribbella aluminosa TaxID=416017 RepID=A0ABS4UGQ4_9ACTN|nr:SMC-Scp complex subunit ScpB [Kribbella aluminosa]MBP2350824.1 segregation and condensation protein B [Kribbella aluminosa]
MEVEPAEAAPAGAGQMALVVGDEVVVDDATMRRAIEAILMVTDEPLPVLTLARAVGRTPGDIAAALEGLAAEYTEQGRGFDLREIGGGWRFYTRPDAAQYVERFVLDGQQSRITQAALETLAVVAYKQPVSRARVSAIRGVNVDGVMRTLVARGLVEEAGADTESQATLYRTTTYFLERMGMQSLDDLPELAPYLPEMDDIEEELAAQTLPPADPTEAAGAAAAADEAATDQAQLTGTTSGAETEDDSISTDPAAREPGVGLAGRAAVDDELEFGTPEPAIAGDGAASDGDAVRGAHAADASVDDAGDGSGADTSGHAVAGEDVELELGTSDSAVAGGAPGGGTVGGLLGDDGAVDEADDAPGADAAEHVVRDDADDAKREVGDDADVVERVVGDDADGVGHVVRDDADGAEHGLGGGADVVGEGVDVAGRAVGDGDGAGRAEGGAVSGVVGDGVRYGG